MPEGAPSGPPNVPEEAPLNIVNWQGPSGPITPIFSARERVEQVVQETGQTNGFVAIEGRAVFGMLAQKPQDAILNPGFPYGKQFTTEEIGRLADGTFFEPERREATEPTRVLLGQPAVYPRALVDALARLFAERSSVEAAYLAQIHFPDDATAPHPIIGVLSAEYEKEIREIGLVAKEAYGSTGPVDFLDMRAATEGIVVYLRDKTVPFYVRAGADGALRKVRGP